MAYYGWLISCIGLIVALIGFSVSPIWHWLDKKADACFTESRELLKLKQRESASEINEKGNKLLKIQFYIRLFGWWYIWLGTGVSILGAVLLALGSKP